MISCRALTATLFEAEVGRTASLRRGGRSIVERRWMLRVVPPQFAAQVLRFSAISTLAADKRQHPVTAPVTVLS
jgi:hypothetical protein